MCGGWLEESHDFSKTRGREIMPLAGPAQVCSMLNNVTAMFVTSSEDVNGCFDKVKLTALDDSANEKL